MHLVYAHYLKTTNVGDLVAGAWQYFMFDGASHEVVHISDLSPKHMSSGGVIIGGGAVAGAARKLAGRLGDTPIVAWGVGQTKHGATQRYVAPHAGLYTLYGSREVPLQPGERWVPCPSCMHPTIADSRGVPAKRSVGLYVNSDPNILKRYPLPARTKRMPKMNNRASVEDAIRFLASSEVVITNSYHGAYWAQLLGRRVVLVGAYSAKFFGYQNQPPVWKGGDWETVASGTRAHPDALESARNANIAFQREVANLLRIDQ